MKTNGRLPIKTIPVPMSRDVTEAEDRAAAVAMKIVDRIAAEIGVTDEAGEGDGVKQERG